MNRILIVEDQRLEKQYMESIIESDGRCTLAGTLSNAAAAEIFCQGHSVDLILMDICTENHENGLDAAAVIKRSSPEIKIVIVTSTVENDALERARDCGVESFWYKDSSPEELADVIERTLAGNRCIPCAFLQQDSGRRRTTTSLKPNGASCVCSSTAWTTRISRESSACPKRPSEPISPTF